MLRQSQPMLVLARLAHRAGVVSPSAMLYGYQMVAALCRRR
jgi:hypothetical protein